MRKHSNRLIITKALTRNQCTVTMTFETYLHRTDMEL